MSICIAMHYLQLYGQRCDFDNCTKRIQKYCSSASHRWTLHCRSSHTSLSCTWDCI